MNQTWDNINILHEIIFKMKLIVLLIKLIFYNFVETIYLSKDKIQFESYCNKNNDCFNLKDSKFICNNSKCICDNNYQYDISDNTCKPFICQINSDCQELDKNRFCEFGQCKCGLNYSVDSMTKICIKKPGYRFYWFWCFVFLIPSIVASIHGLIRKHRIIKKLWTRLVLHSI